MKNLGSLIGLGGIFKFHFLFLETSLSRRASHHTLFNLLVLCGVFDGLSLSVIWRGMAGRVYCSGCHACFLFHSEYLHFVWYVLVLFMPVPVFCSYGCCSQHFPWKMLMKKNHVRVHKVHGLRKLGGSCPVPREQLDRTEPHKGDCRIA